MAPAWSLVGLAYARLGHGTLAVEALRQAATLDPHREEGWLNLTRELMELGRYAEAISAAEKGIAANPNSYVLQLRLGAASLAAGQYHDAERVFRSLADAGDPLPTSYIGLAQVLLREGRAEDAVSELSAARERIGSNFLINYFLGLSLDRAAKQKGVALGLTSSRRNRREVCGSSLSVARRARLLQGFARTAFSQTNSSFIEKRVNR